MTGLLIGMMALNIALLVYRGWVAPRRRRAQRRSLERMARVAIAAVPQRELTKVVGVVAPRDATMTSPIGGQPCIGFSGGIEESTGGGMELWRPLLKRGACGSFLLTDESGTAVVEGSSVITLDPDENAWTNLPATVINTPAHKLLRAEGLSFAFSREIRYQEALLRPGDRVSVLGRPALETDPAARGWFRDPPMRNHIRGSEDEPVLIAPA